MTPDDIRQQIELKVVELIKARLADGSITEERAQKLSQIVLDTITPGMSFEALYKAVAKLDDFAPELAPIVLPLMREYEDTVVAQAQDRVRTLIREGQYDAATKLAKNAINQSVTLVWKGAGQVASQDHPLRGYQRSTVGCECSHSGDEKTTASLIRSCVCMRSSSMVGVSPYTPHGSAKRSL